MMGANQVVKKFKIGLAV